MFICSVYYDTIFFIFFLGICFINVNIQVGNRYKFKILIIILFK